MKDTTTPSSTSENIDYGYEPMRDDKGKTPTTLENSFARHLLHDDEYPPEVTAKTTAGTPQPAKKNKLEVVYEGESQKEGLAHFAQHLLHSSEAFVTKKE